MSHYAVTHKDGEGYDASHVTVQGAATLKRTIDFVSGIDADLRYQYYVTEADNGQIINEENADKWLERNSEP